MDSKEGEKEQEHQYYSHISQNWISILEFFYLKPGLYSLCMWHTPHYFTFLKPLNLIYDQTCLSMHFSKCLAAVHVQLLYYNFVWNLPVLKRHPSSTYIYSLCLITFHDAVQNALVFPLLHSICLQPAFHHVYWCGGDPWDGSCETTA